MMMTSTTTSNNNVDDDDNNSVASTSSDHTSSTSSTAAVATPSRKYRNDTQNNNNDPSNGGAIDATTASATVTMSLSGGASVTSSSSVLGAPGGSLMDQKKMRKRMALMTLEQNKKSGSGNYASIVVKGRSFDQDDGDKAVASMQQQQQAKQGCIAVTSSASNSPKCLVMQTTCGDDMNQGTPTTMQQPESSSVSNDRGAELRRRRLYEMHHNRPYSSSQSKPKKKFKFWEQDKPSPFRGGRTGTASFEASSSSTNRAAAVFLPSGPQLQQSSQLVLQEARRVSSFSDYQDLSTPEARRHYREVTFQDDNNAMTMMDHSSFRGGSSSFDLDSSWIHSSSGGGGSKLYLNVNDLEYDDIDDDDEEPSDIPLHVSPRRALWNEQASALQTQMQNLVLRPSTKNDEDKDEIMDGLVYDSDEIMTPIKDRTYVTLPSRGFKILKPDLTSEDPAAAMVSPDAATSLISPLNAVLSFETPEKIAVPLTVTAFDIEDLTSRQVTSSAFVHEDVPVLSPPNAPRKERHHKMPTDPKGIATRSATRTTPVPADIAMTSSPTDVVSMGVGDETMGLQPMTAAVKLSVSPTTGAIHWQSLRRNGNGEFSVSNGANSTRIASMREVSSAIQALAEKENHSTCAGRTSNNNLLKLFVDLYQQSTYDEIVQRIPELKDQGTLVICRGFDFSASTFNNVSEMKSLLEALKNVSKLDSIMLLNFCPESMVDLAKILNQHPFMFRLQLHLAEGTLNGELLGVMATAPRLTHVQLDLKESCAIGTLLNSKSIQSLRVTSKEIELAKSHVRTLIYSLGSNQTLTTLDLAPKMSIEHFRSLCSALKENRRLECLRVSLNLNTEEDSQVAAIELANLLKVNRSLVTFWNHLHEDSRSPNHVGKRVLQEAFRKNSVIRELKLYPEDPDNSIVTLEKNQDYVLGIQPRQQRHVAFSQFVDEPSTLEDATSESDSYSRDGDWLVGSKFCDEMFNSIPTTCSDCMIPDIGEVLRDFTRGPTTSKKNGGGSSVSVL